MKTKLILAFFICAMLSVSVFAQGNATQNEPTPILKHDIGITREKLLQTKTVEDLLDGFPKNDYEVIVYKLTIVEKGEYPVEFEGHGNKLSDKMKEKIKLIPGGSLLYIEYVKGELKNSHDGSSTRSFPPVSYVLVEK